MITLTEEAAVQVQALLQQQEMPEHGLRIFVQGGGCSGLQYGLAFENTTQEDDVVVEEKGIRLFVDPFSAQYLQGASIDYQEGPTGSGFRIDNPNAPTGCGCGSSSSCCEDGGDGTGSCCG